MKTVIVDYSKVYYSQIAGFKIPDEYSGKFVQIQQGENEYLVFSPKEFTKYHANIVEYFSKDRRLIGSYDSDHKRYDIFESGWNIIGGGKFEIRRKEKILRLYDDSMAYGKFRSEGLTERLLKTEEFSDYRIIVE